MYLLLRNNKQSGPYSLDDLKSMGLKAYDLVWSEGKSAAWRYPSEIEELSTFAPPVEEQPFDRFYKKPVAAQPVAQPAPAPVTLIAPVAEAPAPTIVSTSEPSTVPGKRIIYVTMPSSRTPAPASTAPNREIPREQPVVRETPKEHSPYASGPSHATHRVEDYSAQLPSLEEQLEAVSPRLTRRWKDNRARILKPVAIAVAILALLAAGIFIGLSLNKNSASLPQRIATKGADKNTPSIAHPVSQQLPVPATPSLTAATTEKPMDSIRTIADPVEASVPPVTKPIHPVTARERPASSKKGTPTPPVVKDSAAGMNSAHREAVRRSDIIETKAESKAVDKEAVRTTISSQVSVGANSYTVGTFGGINDLQLTVTNRSVYPLDLVVVEVQYIQANKKVYKSENLYFRNIGAGSALMQEAPKSSRGIKVQYKITTISSRDLGLSYSGI